MLVDCSTGNHGALDVREDHVQKVLCLAKREGFLVSFQLFDKLLNNVVVHHLPAFPMLQMGVCVSLPCSEGIEWSYYSRRVLCCMYTRRVYALANRSCSQCQSDCECKIHF